MLHVKDHRSIVRPVPTRTRLIVLLASTALVGANPAFTQSLPTGGSVAAGSVTIGTPSNGTLTINQTSANAVVNWQNFNIGQGNGVTFVQPNASSAILNRVIGSTTTTIAGSLTANGQVYLVNPNGIAITPTGTINTGAFVASTLGISDDDFMAGKRTFTGNGASSSVTNAGTITINRSGYLALIGRSVENSGVITVPMGKVALGSGEQATLDLAGDGFLQVAIPTTAAGTKALVSNSGKISANGGTVQLSAAAARDMARQAVNMSGTIEAKGVSGRSGDITLTGGDGEVAISGTLNASNAAGIGGKVTVTGRSIKLASARVNASGKSGGGTINIGGERQGSGTLKHAETLTVDAGTVINADAITTGNGGNVVLWSDDRTQFEGLITARGGSLSGNGADVEVSGKALLSYTGFTDLTAANGAFGNLLLDPYNVTISSGTDSNSSGFTATGDDSVINVSTLEAALAGANVTVTTGDGSSAGSQAGTITVADALSWSAGTTLTLSAASDIAINAAITASGTSAGVVLQADNSGTSTGTVSFGAGGSVNLSGSASTANIYYNPAMFGTATDFSGNVTANSLVAYQLVNNPTGLQSIQDHLTGSFALGKDIDASDTANWNYGFGFRSIGTDGFQALNGGAGFAGNFDGQGHTISGLTIDNQLLYAYTGLFGYVGPGATIANVGLIGGSITGAQWVGSLVGYNNGGTITNVYATGAIIAPNGGTYIGGLVGYNNGTITNAYTTGAVGGWDYVGGLVGYNDGGGTITNAHASGNVTIFDMDAGGLVGTNYGTITNAYATGSVTGNSYVGGLVGENYGTITSAHATGAVTSYLVYSGGLVGYNDGTIAGAYATGAVSGSDYVGGLVGYNKSGRTITNAYATGPVSAGLGLHGYYAGGLVGYNDHGTITDAYATGAVGAIGEAGGLVGFNYGGTITNVYAAGAVTSTGSSGSTGNFGGLVGHDLSGTLRNVYATGAVSGTYYFDNLDNGKFGGLVGFSDHTTITNAYATGAVSGTFTTSRNWNNYNGPYLGGLVGGSEVATVSSSFWDIETTGQPSGGGQVQYPYSFSAIGLTTAQMKDPFTFINAGWDFLSDWGKSTSGANSGYMMLRALSTGLYDDYISIGSATRVYGDANSTISGAALTGVGTGNVSLSWGSAVGAATNAGTYNYSDANIVSVTGSRTAYIDTSNALTIAARPITATATSGQSFSYGDTPTLAYSVTSGSLVNSDTLSGALAGITSSSDVGTYALTQGTLSASSNYALTYVGANATVTQRALTVTADALSKTYGDANPALTYTISGLVNGDMLSGSLLTSAGQYSDVGNYAVGLGTLAASSNYAITYNTANLTINQRTLAVTADGLAKTYGDANPALTYTVSGLVNNDTLSGSLSTPAGRYSDAGTYGITIGTLANSNYSISYTGADLTINQRALTVTADALSKTYGDINPALTYTTSGLVNGDTLSGSLSTPAGRYSDAGTYGITIGTLANSNYSISYTGADLTINQRALTVTADALSKTYGDINPALTYTTSGLVNGDTLSGSLSTPAGQYSDAGTYGITIGTLVNSNYSISYTGANLTINRRALTVTADALTKTYGDINPTLTYTATGLVNGDTLSGSLSTSAGRYSDVGNYGVTIGTLANSNYAISYTGANLTIGQRAITVQADAASKTYGDINPTLTYTTSGLVNNDTLSGSLSTPVGQYSNVGSYGITIGSLGNTNYAITYNAADLTITPRALTVTADALSKTYGDANPALTYTVGGSGLVNNDMLSGTLSTTAGQYSNVGAHAITQGSLANANYAISYTGANLTVNPRALTVTADALSKIYGDANPALTYTATGLVNNDTLSGSLSTSAGQYSNVGSYGITIGSLGNANYAFTYNAANLTITPRALTVTADALSKTYGDANPALTYTVGGSGLVNNDMLSGTLSTTAGQYSNVGAHAITQGSLANANYAISYTGANLTVNPRALTVTADALSKIYGDANPALTYTATGLVNNDTLSGSLSTSAGQYSNVGSYGITIGSLGNANYAFTYNAANLTITPRALTVTADALSKTYGDGNPALTYMVGGLVNNDTLSGSLSTTAGQYSDVGAYAITQGSLANANYAISYTGANLTVTPRALTVTADALSKTYGDANPALTYTAAGLVNNDTLSGSLSTSAGQYSNVGAYAITGSFSASSNYALTYVGANLSINQRAITVTADAQSKTYGDVNPALSYTVGGASLVNGDTLSGSLSTTAGQYSNVGAYAITQGTLLASANYRMSFLPGVLTVEKAADPRPGTQASSVTPTFDAGRFVPIRPVSDDAETADDSRDLITDPRFKGTFVCLANGSGCVSLPAQSTP
ncbi:MULTISPECIES: MBG domain-containing protein [unclassified Neorhizobium]|uniref:MBG domain-containing protein n=1 Tax=unclassified Neorhizobium TaxID=2629175 RepID=UPI001FF10AD9|nr:MULTISPECIES: MBG domain-containing protein [unclassified Neorhizobium]MCJ9669944.1 filamentous hemagglutinin N-terminal domain-containing protein [Neorhizobium sp. SHOUNA12B]MCJ9744761.1 filamentous hemagglutinin N-terminal domain-containing protein [Neorhizobium sp. SHOUNA12A]